MKPEQINARDEAKKAMRAEYERQKSEQDTETEEQQ